MRSRELETIVRAIGRTVPPDLASIMVRLGQSAWPEIVERWSRLTPSGFPIEITVTNADSALRWTSEIAGPEIPDAERLGRVAMYLASAGQPLPDVLLDGLQAAQRGRDLRYGAWLGGRAVADAPSRFKLYGEIPSGVPLHEIPLPAALMEIAARAPVGTLPRMIGSEPARGRTEIYLRLPALEPEDLRPFLSAAGHPHGLDALSLSLPDGERRIAGRKLGISLATCPSESIEVALFVSARTLFPGAPEMLRELVPAIANIPDTHACPNLVTLRLDPKSDQVTFAAGVTVAARVR